MKNSTLSFVLIAITMLSFTVLVPDTFASSDSHTDTTHATQSSSSYSQVTSEQGWPNIHANTVTDFSPVVVSPTINDDAFIHPFAIVIGHCNIGEGVFVAPTAVCRGDEGTPIKVNSYANMQDGVVIHSLETESHGVNIDGRKFSSDGYRLDGNDPRFESSYAVWIGSSTSLAHGAMIHGPTWIGDHTFVGMETIIFNAKVGNNVAIGVASVITGGITIPDGKYVPPGSVIHTQQQADALSDRIGSPYEGTNKAVVHVNSNFAKGYDEYKLEKTISLRESQMEEQYLETQHVESTHETQHVESTHEIISGEGSYASYKGSGGTSSHETTQSHEEPSH